MDKFKQVAEILLKSKIIKIFILLFLLLAVLLPSFVYYITIDDGTYKEDDWESTPYVASTYTAQAKITDDGIATEGTAEELWDEMIKKGNNVEQYLDKPEELEKLMNAEIITQYPRIGKGEIDGIIEFERHKTDGTSTTLTYKDSETFNEYVNNGNDEALDYFTLDEQGNVLIAIKNKITEDLSTDDNEMDVSEYTDTLDDTNKQEDGTYSRTQPVITVMNPSINYKNIVQKYTMPFQYLWTLLVITDDKDFVLELADLVEDSEIVISIYDNITTREITEEYTYKIEERTDTYAEVLAEEDYGVKNYPKERYWLAADSPEASEHYNEDYEADYYTYEHEYSVKKVTKYENNTPIIDVTKANTWIVDYSKEYTYQAAESASDNDNEKTLDPTEYEEKSNSPVTSETNSLLLQNVHAKKLAQEAKEYIEKNMKDEDNTNNTTGIFDINSDDTLSVNSLLDNNLSGNNKKDVKVNVKFVQCRYYTHEIDRKQKTTETSSVQKYVAGPTKNVPKVEKDADEENFVTILSSKEHKSARKNIEEVYSWLFELLEVNETTANMVDLTKYLLYKVTEKNYGITEYDFSVYQENYFSSITSSGTDISLINTMFTKEVFVQALTEYSNDGASGNKSNFDKNFLSRAEEIYDLGIKYNLNPEMIVTMALKESGFDDEGTNNFWGLETPNGSAKKSYSSFEEAIKKLASTFAAYMPGGNLSSMIENRAAERQAAGCNSNGYGNSGTLKGMLSVYSDLCGSDTKHREGNSGNGGNYYLKVIYGNEFNSKCGSVHKIGVDDYTIQEKADYTGWLYENQLAYWDKIFGKFGKLSSGNTEQIQNMIDRAIEIANDDSHGYVWGATGPQNFDCSGFMQYLYREYCGIELPRTSEEQCKYGESQNAEIPSFTADNKNFNDLQAGDLLWVSGHVGMYIGDGKFVHAASTETGIVVAKLSTRQNGQKPFTKAFRIVK